MTNKTRATYTEEQKLQVKSMLQEGAKHADIEKSTGVARSTINKIAAEIKVGKKTSNIALSTSSSPVPSLEEELKTIKARKEEIEALLNGKLKNELEEISQKQTAIETLLKLYL